jgi:hypothetical protein
MPRKSTDPRRIALEDQAHQARVDFQRNYILLKCIFQRCEKARQRLIRLQQLLARLDTDPRATA